MCPFIPPGWGCPGEKIRLRKLAGFHQAGEMAEGLGIDEARRRGEVGGQLEHREEKVNREAPESVGEG